MVSSTFQTFCETYVLEIQTRHIGTLLPLKKNSLGNKKMKRMEWSKTWASGFFPHALLFSFIRNLYVLEPPTVAQKKDFILFK